MSTPYRTTRHLLLEWGRQTLSKELNRENVSDLEMNDPNPEMKMHMLNVFGFYWQPCQDMSTPWNTTLIVGLKQAWEKMWPEHELIICADGEENTFLPPNNLATSAPVPPPPPPYTPPPYQRRSYTNLAGVTLNETVAERRRVTVWRVARNICVDTEELDIIINEVVEAIDESDTMDTVLEAIEKQINDYIDDHMSEIQDNNEFEYDDEETDDSDTLDSSITKDIDSGTLHRFLTTHMQSMGNADITAFIQNQENI